MNRQCFFVFCLREGLGSSLIGVLHLVVVSLSPVKFQSGKGVSALAMADGFSWTFSHVFSFRFSPTFPHLIVVIVHYALKAHKKTSC